MQYYQFQEACATKETGQEYPQIQKWKQDYDDDKVDSYYSYWEASARGSIFPDFEPDMDALILHSRAKATDLLSGATTIGFIISQKLKLIFEEFKFPPHRFYPTKIIYKKTALEGYYLMHLISKHFEDYLDDVDYTRSTFIICGIAGSNSQPIELTSKDDYLNQSRQLQEDFKENKISRHISAKKIYFNESFDKTLDCFKAPFGIHYYISQRLKDALIDNGVTGCEIQFADLISF
jgi:hypothetical protein